MKVKKLVKSKLKTMCSDERPPIFDDVDSSRAQRVLIKSMGCIYSLSTCDSNYLDPEYVISIAIDLDSGPVECVDWACRDKYPPIGEQWLEDCRSGLRTLAVIDSVNIHEFSRFVVRPF